MRKLALLAWGAAVIISQATAQNQPPVQSKQLKAEYTIYAGELGNEQAAIKTDRKLAVEISGQAAKDIFDSIYPDATVRCSDEKGERLRRKKNLWCIYQPKDGYRCFLGFDLRTGDSIPGGSC
ncbi:hypothetical protein MJ904_09590 [Massilia sp. MB5]|uniref:hypothetical protein n=1 Tax=Massilia sp. MB5 TaxID=2919578 RepID=UPI001F0CE631|nr:hypothetical protein [Massilia sp. MB5]UMR32392.1 hypothetical protein MJ904_09590 [Massilia sp. MB5]